MIVLFTISKLLFALASPLGLTLAMLLALSLAILKTRKWLGLLGLTVAFGMALCSTKPVAVGLALLLEHNQVPRPASDYPVASAIVILGGVTEADVPASEFPGLGSAADRVRMAARLFAAGRAPVIVLLGGGPEGQPSEAEAMKVLLLEWGVPEAALALEDQSLTTWENAVNFRDHFPGREPFLLVTSAWHMERSVWVFNAIGLDPIPAPTDFQGLGRRLGQWTDWLPSAQSLETSSVMIHEMGGMVFYRIRSLATGG